MNEITASRVKVREISLQRGKMICNVVADRLKLERPLMFEHEDSWGLIIGSDKRRRVGLYFSDRGVICHAGWQYPDVILPLDIDRDISYFESPNGERHVMFSSQDGDYLRQLVVSANGRYVYSSDAGDGSVPSFLTGAVVI